VRTYNLRKIELEPNISSLDKKTTEVMYWLFNKQKMWEICMGSKILMSVQLCYNTQVRVDYLIAQKRISLIFLKLVGSDPKNISIKYCENAQAMRAQNRSKRLC